MHDLLNNLIIFIENHKNIAYLILFLWSIWEAFFPFSLFLYWEIFFLSWSILAWYGILNIFIVIPVLLFWWLLWDNLSYFLWFNYWDKILSYFKKHRFFWKYLNEKNVNKLEKFFNEKWWYWVLIARFSWPLARITPFIAWTFKLKYKQFIKFDILWVVGWIWLFIFVWYFFWKNFDLILSILWNSIKIVILIIIMIILILSILKKYKKNKNNDWKKYK